MFLTLFSRLQTLHSLKKTHLTDLKFLQVHFCFNFLLKVIKGKEIKYKIN